MTTAPLTRLQRITQSARTPKAPPTLAERLDHVLAWYGPMWQRRMYGAAKRGHGFAKIGKISYTYDDATDTQGFELRLDRGWFARAHVVPHADVPAALAHLGAALDVVCEVRGESVIARWADD